MILNSNRNITPGWGTSLNRYFPLHGVFSSQGAFLAGKCFLRYRRAGGARRSPLPQLLSPP